MDVTGWLSVLSFGLSAVALTVSWWQARRGVQVAGNANEIHIVADIFRDVRSPQFREKLDTILRCPPEGHLECGFESLDEPLRESAYAVCYLFEDLGVLVSNNLVRREIILSTVSSILTRAWHTLRPAIDAEREFRRRTYATDISPTFLPHFEALVSMAATRRSASTARQARLVENPQTESVHRGAPRISSGSAQPEPR